MSFRECTLPERVLACPLTPPDQVCGPTSITMCLKRNAYGESTKAATGQHKLATLTMTLVALTGLQHNSVQQGMHTFGDGPSQSTWHKRQESTAAPP
jgi:hypothetical protein